MPRVDKLLDCLGKANFISTMDLIQCYWQVPVAEQDRHKTAFNLPFRLLKPEVDKLQAIKQLPIPKIKRDVRAFLGVAGYYRKFIANYATVAAPLTDLTKKNFQIR